MKAIQTKYLGPTTFRGSRVKAWDSDNNSVTLSWDHALNTEANHRSAANALCLQMNWACSSLIGGWIKTGMVFVFTE